MAAHAGTAPPVDPQSGYKAEIRDALQRGGLTIIVGAGVTLGALACSTVQKTDREKAERRNRLTWLGLLRSGLVYVANEERSDHWEQSEKDEHDLYMRVLQPNPHFPTAGTIIRAAGFLKSMLVAENLLPDWHKFEFRTLYDEWIGSQGNPMLDAFRSFYADGASNGARIITTNYDDLLCRHCNGAPYVLPGDGKRLDRFFTKTSDKKAILHVHGHWDDYERTVLDAVDYHKVTEDSALDLCLKSIFITSEILMFVGTGGGLADPHFNPLLRWAADKLSKDSKRHFILLRNGEKHEHKYFTALRFGDNYADLPGFLQSLVPPRVANEQHRIPELPFPSNPHFVNQSEVLNALDEKLSAPSGLCIAVLHGISGVGKTQCATQYCHARVTRYPGGIYWFSARSTVTMEHSWRVLASSLELSHDEQKLTSAPKFFLQRKEWLCVLDDINDFKLMAKILSPQSVGSVILITNDPARINLTSMRAIAVEEFKSWKDVIRLFLLSLKSWTDEESLYIRGNFPDDLDQELWPTSTFTSFLEQTLNINTPSELVNVVSLTGNLPRSIEFVAAYLRTYQMSYDACVTQFHGIGAPMGAVPATDPYESENTEPNQDISRVWELSFRRLKDESAVAISLLTCFAFLNHTRISENLIKFATEDVFFWGKLGHLRVPDFVKEQFPFLEGNKSKFTEALGRLRALGFVKRTAQGILSMDRMVHRSVRQRLDLKHAAKAVENILCLLCNQLPPSLYSTQRDQSAPQHASDIFIHLEDLSRLAEHYLSLSKGIRPECAVFFVEAYLWYYGSQYLTVAEKLVDRVQKSCKGFVQRLIYGARLHQIVSSFQADVETPMDRLQYDSYLRKLTSLDHVPPGSRYTIVQAVIAFRLMKTLDRKISGSPDQIKVVQNNAKIGGVSRAPTSKPSSSAPFTAGSALGVSSASMMEQDTATRTGNSFISEMKKSEVYSKVHAISAKLKTRLSSSSPKHKMRDTNKMDASSTDTMSITAPAEHLDLWDKPQPTWDVEVPANITMVAPGDISLLSRRDYLDDAHASTPMILEGTRALLGKSASILHQKMFQDQTLPPALKSSSPSSSDRSPVNLICNAILFQYMAHDSLSRNFRTAALEHLTGGREGAVLGSKLKLFEFDEYIDDLVDLQLQACIENNAPPSDGIEVLKIAFECQCYDAISNSSEQAQIVLSRSKGDDQALLLNNFAPCPALFHWVPVGSCFVDLETRKQWLKIRVDSLMSAGRLGSTGAVPAITELGKILLQQDDGYARVKSHYDKFLAEYIRLDDKENLASLAEEYYTSLNVRSDRETIDTIRLCENMMCHAEDSDDKNPLSQGRLLNFNYERWAVRLLRENAGDGEDNALKFCIDVLERLTRTKNASRCSEWGFSALGLLNNRKDDSGILFCRKMVDLFHTWPDQDYRVEFINKWASEYDKTLGKSDTKSRAAFYIETAERLKGFPGSNAAARTEAQWRKKAELISENNQQ